VYDFFSVSVVVCLVGLMSVRTFFCDYLVISKKLDGNLLLNLITSWVPVQIIYTYIFMIHYKSLILILSTCKYDTSPNAMSPFSIEK
jgi:hypothetical protein